MPVELDVSQNKPMYTLLFSPRKNLTRDQSSSNFNFNWNESSQNQAHKEEQPRKGNDTAKVFILVTDMGGFYPLLKIG